MISPARPLLAPVCAFMAGMLLARCAALPAWPALATCAILLAWAGRDLRAGHRADVRLLCACLALGGAHLRAWDSVHPDPALAALGRVEHPVVVEGDVRAAWTVAGEYREEVRLDLALCSVEVGKECLRASGPLSARLEGTSPVPAGSRVRLRGFASPWRAVRNPGGFNEASNAADRGLPFSFRVPSAGACEVLDAPRGGRGWIGGLREGMERRLRERFPGERGRVLATLLVGAPWDFPDDLEWAFRRTGTVHLLAISGLHLGLVAGAVWFCVRRLAFLGSARFAICALLILLYAALVGPLSPVVRSAVLVLVFLAARASGRRVDVWNLLALAAALILAVFPAELFRLGFQLSFLACAGIVLSARLPLSAEGRSAPVRWALRSLAVSFGASAAVTPLLWHHFHILSPVSLLANLPLVPLLGVVLAGAFLSVSLGGIPLLGGAVVLGTDLSVRLLIAIVRLFGAIPGGSVTLAGPSISVCVLIYAALGGLVACSFLSRSRLRGAAMAVLACVLVAACLARPAPSGAGVVFLDVGQGSASVFWDGKGGVAACDCGTSGREVA
ncbi:MAG: ComEC/Rec2 family competence protein, partial [Planctomycetes bacterium]|nr:ComEC/Rec2 family competence protein [Planctomycetota bacterium]